MSLDTASQDVVIFYTPEDTNLKNLLLSLLHRNGSKNLFKKIKTKEVDSTSDVLSINYKNKNVILGSKTYELVKETTNITGHENIFVFNLSKEQEIFSNGYLNLIIKLLGDF